jgi:hypothetical protein
MRGFDRRKVGRPAETANDGSAPAQDMEAALAEVYLAQKALWAAVDTARQIGLTWEDIGQRLGLSAETVHRRNATWVPIDKPPRCSPF